MALTTAPGSTLLPGHRMIRLPGAGLLSLLVLSPVAAQAPSPARTSLIEAERSAAGAVFQQGLPGGIEALLADGAVLLLEGAPLIVGRDRIAEVLGSQPVVKPLRIQRVPVVIAMSEDGTYGATTGISIIARVGQPPDSTARVGHYMMVWRRADASTPWRIVALLENGLMGNERFQSPPGFRPGAAPPITGSARALADADLAFARMATDSGVHAAFGNYAAPDATFPPGESDMAIGAYAIRSRMATPARMQSVWAWHPVFGGATTAGDFGFTIGESTIRSSRAADATVYEGKYLTVWRRQPDGTVKFIFDSGNARE